jgi:hypothetical protein
MNHCTPVRLLAVVLVAVLVMTVSMPAKAEADVLAAIAIGTLAVAGLMLVVYLIVASASDSKRADGTPPVRLACAGDACVVIPAHVIVTPLPVGATETP